MPSGQVRSGWREHRFDELATLITDRIVDPSKAAVDRYVGLEHLDSDSLRITRWGVPSDVEATKLLFRKGDIIFGRRRAYQRKIAVAEFDGICSAHAMVLRAKPAAIVPEFLPFLMQSDLFMTRAQEISVGSLSPTINWTTLAEQEFVLPPLDEQRRTAILFAAIQDATESLRRLLALGSVTESALYERLLNRSQSKVVPLGSVLSATPRNGHSTNATAHETGHWVLALSAITPRGYRRGELKAVERTPAMEAATLRGGDLVISRSNTRALVGLPAIFDEDRNDVSWPDTMTRLIPDETRMSKRFLELFLRSRAGREQIESHAAGTSASMKKINGATIAKLLIPCPTLETQRRIEHAMDAVRRARQATEERIRQLVRLRQRLADTLVVAVLQGLL